MLFAGLGSVHKVKNCDRGLENAARGRRPRTAFSSRGHSFSLYGPTLSRQITYLSFPAVNWLTSGFVYAAQSVIESAYVPPVYRTIRKNI